MPKIFTDVFKSALNPINDGMAPRQVCADFGIWKSALQSLVRNSCLREYGCEPATEPEESCA